MSSSHESINSSFSTLLKGAGVVLGGQFFIKVTGFIYHVLVVRLLGAEKLGTFSMVHYIIKTVAQLSLTGLSTGTVYYISKYHDPFDKTKVRDILYSSLKILSITCSIFTLATFFFSEYYVQNILQFDDIQILLNMAAFAIPLIVLFKFIENVFKGLEEADFGYRLKLIHWVGRLLFIPTFLFFTNSSLFWGILASILTFLSPVIYGLYLFHQNFFSIFEIPSLNSTSYVKSLFTFSWPLALSGYVQEVFQRADFFLIGFFLGDYQAGLYKPAIVISEMLRLIPMAFTYLMFPVMNELLEKNKKNEFRTVSERTFKVMLYANTVVVAGLALLAKPLIKILYGSEFIDTRFALIVLSLSIFTKTLHDISNYLIHSKERTELLLGITVGTFSVNIIGNILLIPLYGIEGAAIATLGSMVLRTVLSLIVAFWLTGYIIFPVRTLVVLFLGIFTCLYGLYFAPEILKGSLVFLIFLIVSGFMILILDSKDMKVFFEEIKKLTT